MGILKGMLDVHEGDILWIGALEQYDLTNIHWDLLSAHKEV